jgi:hypothetical protein
MLKTTEPEEDHPLTKKLFNPNLYGAKPLPKQEEPKLCPFIVRTTINLKDGAKEIRTEIHDCLKDKCALWVKGYKQTMFPDVIDTFEGCGLINQIFWLREKRI